MILRICLYFMILYGINCQTCNFNVKIEQKLYNEGFHRNLSYHIDFASHDAEKSLMYKDCEVGIEQTLPAGVYASKDELIDYCQKNSIKTVFLTPVDIEVNAAYSNPIVIQIFSKVINSKSTFSIPVHARYHEAAHGGRMAKNFIPPPKLYLKCPHNKLNICKEMNISEKHINTFCNEDMSKICEWKPILAIMVTKTLVWKVPIGNLEHYYIVAWITSIVIVLASLYLIKNLHEHHFKVESIMAEDKLNENRKKKTR